MSKKEIVLSNLGQLDSDEAHQLFNKTQIDGQIRVGLYDEPGLTIEEATLRLLKKMDKILPSIKKSTKMLIIGAGYGDTARFFGEKYNCKIDCLNPDPVQNAINEQKNKAADLQNYINITEGSFEQVPHIGEDYDIIWAQDVLLFAPDKSRLFREAARALKPEGRFIFTAIMEKEMNFGQDLEDLLEHLQLEELTTLSIYKRLANQADLEQVYIREFPDQLSVHYGHVLEKIKATRPAKGKLEPATLEGATKAIQLWMTAFEKGILNWGILQFQKRNV